MQGSASEFYYNEILCENYARTDVDFPRDVLDEILNLIESVSEDFPSYSFKAGTEWH